MKKILWTTAAALFLVGCGATNESNESTTSTDEPVVIKVASHLPPMTDVVELANTVIEEPYEVELVEVSDNIQYNEALLNKEVDANFAQHEPFMEQFNEEREGNLVALQTIYNPVVGFYSPTYESIEDIEEGTEVAIPSDTTNESRALWILDSYDLITLDEDADAFSVTVADIIENPLNLTFTSIDLLNLTSAYEDGVPLVFNYPTYIDKIGLKTDDALMLEQDESFPFAIQLVAREDNQDSDAIQALKKAFTSQEVYDFLAELAEIGHLVPAFEPNN